MGKIILSITFLLYMNLHMSISSGQSAARVNTAQAQYDNVYGVFGLVGVNPGDAIQPPVIHNYPFTRIIDSLKKHFMPWEDSVSNGPIMTEWKAEQAIGAIEDDVHIRQSYSDTSTWDATLSDLNTAIANVPGQVNTDWSSSSGKSEIFNKPTLGTAASQNSTAFATAAQGVLAQTALQAEVDGNITNEIQTLSGTGNQVTLSGGGSYTIPSQTFSSLTSKPTTLSGYGIVDAYPLSGNPSGFITSVPAQSFSSLTGKPTTLSGYGITDAYPLIGNPSSFLTSVPAQSFASLTGKPTSLSGYGITDAYPLSGNPSSFLTTVTSGQITTALGYTPYNGTTNSNNYITTAGARTAISLTTTGSGASSYNSSTGALNIPVPSATSVVLRDKSGLLSNSVVFFTDTFSVASATPTIDLSTYISAAGKTSCKILSATGYRVGATTSNSPNVTITAVSSTGVSLIFNQTNTATLTILTFNVLSGLPTLLVPDPVNIKVVLSAFFY